jgi:tight adherence protein B
LESGAPPPAALRHLAAALAKTGDSRAGSLDALALDLEQGITGAAPDPEATPPAAARVDAVLAAIRRRLGRATPPPGESPDAALAVLREAVRMAALAGLPPAALVRRAAAEERRRVGAIRRRAIRRLEVILVLPVGLCLLPAFVLLGVIPVVIDLFSG